MIAAEFARFLGLPVRRSSNITDLIEAVVGVCTDARTGLVLVDELHNISLSASKAPYRPSHAAPSDLVGRPGSGLRAVSVVGGRLCAWMLLTTPIAVTVLGWCGSGRWAAL
ncbi:hypothetical protein [Streptomyces sp. GMY02]|uniref:hypothetical protein n=1 Tax=Streptomyces sp. GMY02 TaxID=1333528 RepID=UPI0020B6A507|nr:hypothetical protein [Streptomyces sp. GMY02]